jgi:hypothetical protein
MLARQCKKLRSTSSQSVSQRRTRYFLWRGWRATKQGRIVGMSLLQSIPVVEPFQGEDVEIIKELFRRTEEFIHQSGAPRVFMHTSNRGMQAMLLRKGAQKLDEPLFDWQR